MRGESDRPPSRPRPTDLCRRKHTNGKKDPALTQSLMLIFKEQGRGPKSPRYEYIPISYVPYTTSAIHHSVNLPRIAWHHITSRRPTSAHPLHPARRHLPLICVNHTQVIGSPSRRANTTKVPTYLPIRSITRHDIEHYPALRSPPSCISFPYLDSHSSLSRLERESPGTGQVRFSADVGELGPSSACGQGSVWNAQWTAARIYRGCSARQSSPSLFVLHFSIPQALLCPENIWLHYWEKMHFYVRSGMISLYIAINNLR